MNGKECEFMQINTKMSLDITVSSVYTVLQYSEMKFIFTSINKQIVVENFKRRKLFIKCAKGKRKIGK